MQTKSPLVRIGIMAGVHWPSLLCFCRYTCTITRFHPSPLRATIQWPPLRLRLAHVCAKRKFDERVWHAAAGVRSQSRTDGSGSSLPGARPEL